MRETARGSQDTRSFDCGFGHEKGWFVMRTFCVRALSVVALAALSVTPAIVAQGQSPASLSETQVQELIARGQPADHARLRAHFNELAEQSAAEAKRHASMQRSFAGNTKLAHIATSIAAHCKRLMDINQSSAATLRELATEHGKLAAGAVYEPPQGGTRPQGSAGIPSDKELADLAANASSAADHRKLEQYFLALANRHDRDAANHLAYAKSWRATTKVSNAQTIAAHCDRLASQFRDTAKEARAAAAMHNDMASKAK